jgi:inorganic pyrophosphatase
MRRLAFSLLVALLWASLLIAQHRPPVELPASAVKTLARNLEAARPHRSHVWRDTPPFNSDGTVKGYVEIARGDRRKFELNMQTNERAIDRILPVTTGGYPVNYGFVPQTVSYDGDPFDVLVLGPPVAGGTVVRGIIVGLMLMEDEKGPDSKVVVSEPGANGKPRYPLTRSDRRRIGDYFNRYKRDEPGAFSRVPGWSSPADGLAFVRTTHAFFKECRMRVDAACRVDLVE